MCASDGLIMLSALQHYSYCPRQCALIHQEQTFTDNLFTVRGQLAHQRVDSGESGMEGEIRIERTLPLFSDRYGLVGKADLVAYQERKKDTLSHPVLEQSVEIGLLPLLQARFLARYLRGDTTAYIPYLYG